MSLKSLAESVIARNERSNRRATDGEKASNARPVVESEELRRMTGIIEEQAEDLRKVFEESAAVLEDKARLPRELAILESARMAATRARSLGYSWAALREALKGYSTLQARLPDAQGPVYGLPLGRARVAIHPRHGVVPQGRILRSR